eukprot:6490374-Amphidinium_carterae.1
MALVCRKLHDFAHSFSLEADLESKMRLHAQKCKTFGGSYLPVIGANAQPTARVRTRCPLRRKKCKHRLVGPDFIGVSTVPSSECVPPAARVAASPEVWPEMYVQSIHNHTCPNPDSKTIGCLACAQHTVGCLDGASNARL